MSIYVKCKRRGRRKTGKWLRNSMSLSHLFSRDVSSDLKAEIINEGQPAHTHTHKMRSALHTLLVLSRKWWWREGKMWLKTRRWGVEERQQRRSKQDEVSKREGKVGLEARRNGRVSDYPPTWTMHRRGQLTHTSHAATIPTPPT